MLRIELSEGDADLVRVVLAHKLHDIAIEINRTDSLDFKATLRETERALERLVQQLPQSE
jgi:hypothetical protein